MDTKQPKPFHMTRNILTAMIAGAVTGILLHQFPHLPYINVYLVDGLFDLGGKIFITILKMVVVPIVFVSLVCGTCQLGLGSKFSRLAAKTIALYLFTTAIAITIALFIAHLLQIGSGSQLIPSETFSVKDLPTLKETLLNIFPSNPVAALAQGNMLQIIVFALLFGLAITWAGEDGQRIRQFFVDLDKVVISLIRIVIKAAPYGVFCLLVSIFARLGFDIIYRLMAYFLTVLLVLFIQLLVTYPTLLRALGRLNPIPFFRKMFPAMLFAFSTSSSSASIPVVLNTAKTQLGVSESVAAFVIPLGATVNMDGTAIMQGVATVFIANAYNIHIGLLGFLKVILTATLASIGTAGVPSVGLVTLTMVLMQVGLPVEGIALIIGVDRLLDMTRTAVNITGDCAIACIVGNSEQELDQKLYHAAAGESK